jgi:hypothetical protein
VSFLTVNGIALPVRQNSMRESWREVGERSESLDGTEHSAIRARKLVLSCELVPISALEAALIRGQLQGRGLDYDSDDDTSYECWTTQGLEPATLTEALGKVSSGGRSWTEIDDGAAVAVAWDHADAFDADDYSLGVLLWISGEGSGHYHHLQVQRGGSSTYHLDGVATAWGSRPSWLTVTSGEIRIAQVSGHNILLGVMSAGPARGEGAQFNAAGYATPWIARPRLTVAGDYLAGLGVSLKMTAKVAGGKPIQVGSAYYTPLEIELSQVLSQV